MSSKPSNPKDIMGIAKAPMSAVPTVVLHEMGLGMLEGALKYGRHNYRAVGVHSSVYYDAVMRHLNQWWEGEDIDQDSGLSHITKALTTLAVLRDSQIRGNVVDDRPPSTPTGWMQRFNDHAAKLIEKYKDRNPKHYTIADSTSGCANQTPLVESVDMFDRLGQKMVARTKEQCDAFYKLGYRVKVEPEKHYHPERPEPIVGIVPPKELDPVIVYHTDQRPNGPCSTAPIKDEIAARGYTIGQLHPSQSTGVDSSDAGDIDARPLAWRPAEGYTG